jgi:predicted ATPase
MLVNKLHIEQFKSLVDLEIINPEPFCVFFGTNASGKSNIFEAIELLQLSTILGDKAIARFGNADELFSYTSSPKSYSFKICINTNLGIIEGEALINDSFHSLISNDSGIGAMFRNNTSRIFINHEAPLQLKDDKRLSHDASNLDSVLKRILDDGTVKEEFIEWMELLIPEFSNIDFQVDEYTGENKILLFEKHSKKPFTKNLISDGTKNIISIFTALFQTSEPQFLLIEEPENGLNPKVVQELARLLREKCDENGTNIWVNTHSQTFVSEIATKEAILVDKIEGRTTIKPLREFDTFSLKVDQAWLLNMFDGGLPW